MKIACAAIISVCHILAAQALQSSREYDVPNRMPSQFKVSDCPHSLTCAGRHDPNSNPPDERSGISQQKSGPPPRRSSPPPSRGAERAGRSSGDDPRNSDLPKSQKATEFSASGNGEIRSADTPSSTPATVEDDGTWTERLPCRCDDQCTLYGDCCRDGPSRDASSSQPAIRPVLEEERPRPPASVTSERFFSCASLNSPFVNPSSDKSVYMVSRCPEDSLPWLADRCHKTVPDTRHKYLLDIPVVSNSSNTVYANRFCAKCHNDGPIAKYNYSISCNCDIGSKSRLQFMEYDKEERLWMSPIPDDEEVECLPGSYEIGCFLFTQYPETTGRPCERELIGKCSNHLENVKDENACGAYNYYVQDPLLNVYKNPECALCNNQSLSDIMCLTPLPNVRFGSSGTNYFHLSDLFSTGEDCTENEVFDIIFEQCSDGFHVDSNSVTAMNIIYIILMSFSLIAMILHMAFFLLLTKKRTLHTKNLFSMIFSLFWAELLLLICSAECYSEIGCYISTIVVYYLFMVAFFWMNAMSYDICKTFRSIKIRGNSHRTYIKYAIYSFTTPAVLAVIAILVDQFAASDVVVTPGFGDGFWFSNRGGLMLFFFGPTEFMFLVNIILLVVSMYDIFQHQKMSKFASATVRKSHAVKGSAEEHDRFIKKCSSDVTNDKSAEATKLNQLQEKIKESIERMKLNKQRLVLYVKLALIMGVPWFFAMFDNISIVCKNIFDILNALQGLFIFLAFDCKRKVLSDVCERVGWQKMVTTLSLSSETQDSSLSNSGARTRVTTVLSDCKQKS